MSPLVSAIIVNYNGRDVLYKAVQSLQKQSYKEIELIVVDNNSVDGSQDIIRKKCKGIKLVQNKENLGYCGINSGLNECKGKYIFFTNNDISLDKNCIKKLVEALETDSAIGIASPKVVNYFNKNSSSCGTWVSKSFYNGHFRCSKDFRKIIPYNGIALIRKNIVDKFGYLFDVDYFTYAEDLDLGLRTRLLGYNVVHIPEAILYHMHSLTLARSKQYKLTYLMEKNLLSTFIKILSLKNIIVLSPYVIGMRLLAIFKDIFTLKFMNLLARLLAILVTFIYLPHLLKKRYIIQNLRRKYDSFLLKVFSEKYILSRQKIRI